MITGQDPNCSYVIDLLKRLLFNSLPSEHGDVHSPNFWIILAAGGVSGLGYTYSAEFVRLFFSGPCFSGTGNSLRLGCWEVAVVSVVRDLQALT